jgi:hypothetical protein
MEGMGGGFASTRWETGKIKRRGTQQGPQRKCNEPAGGSRGGSFRGAVFLRGTHTAATLRNEGNGWVLPTEPLVEMHSALTELAADRELLLHSATGRQSRRLGWYYGSESTFNAFFKKAKGPQSLSP